MKNKNKKPAGKVPSGAVRLHPDDYARLTKLKENIAKHGWEAFGVSRSDTPTLAPVLGAAVEALAAKFTG